MTYGLDTRLFIENGPAAHAADARRARRAYRIWRALDSRTRLNLVERAMKPANDADDGLPLAL